MIYTRSWLAVPEWVPVKPPPRHTYIFRCRTAPGPFLNGSLLCRTQLELVLYGDSIMRHARQMGDDFWDSIYNEWYDSAMAYGIAGNTAAELLWCLRDGEFPMGFHPRAAVLLAGINDIMRAHHPGLDEVTSSDDDGTARELATVEVWTLHSCSSKCSLLLASALIHTLPKRTGARSRVAR